MHGSPANMVQACEASPATSSQLDSNNPRRGWNTETMQDCELCARTSSTASVAGPDLLGMNANLALLGSSTAKEPETIKPSTSALGSATDRKQVKTKSAQGRFRDRQKASCEGGSYLLMLQVGSSYGCWCRHAQKR